MNAQISNYATRYRQAVGQLLAARLELKALREQDATQGHVAAMTPEDLAGENDHLTAADFTAAFATMDALEMILTDFSTVPPTPTAALAALQKFPR